MIPPIRASLLAAAALAALALAGCTGQPAPAPAPTDAAATAPAAGTCAGITVIVDTGDLELSDDISTELCVVTDDPMIAGDALARAGVETEGTAQYGDQVVCRVNGVPQQDLAIPTADGSEYFETCESMPAAFAYWALWQKPADGEWGYAQEGLGTLELQPGDAIELLFTLNDEPAAPAE
ncbi:hypothetical protein M3147_12150 [Agromyces mediolanus]|uniref:hypothetical protein n=1 Tax=Agromyces mediolanus TaxID=41986 RepID=UPI002040C495|nr:hypothetical protein [Agromyces mediolanus]MCM3658003.1 hypothetical protein [Agromyces mediolanus]